MSEYETERWAYAGRRYSAKGQLRYAWLPSVGQKLLLYAKLRASAIGGIYTVEARRDDSVVVDAGSLRYTGDLTDDSKRLEWEVQDRLAVQAADRDRAERKAAKDGQFTEAIAPLKELYGDLRTISQRSAFRAMVMEELSRP